MLNRPSLTTGVLWLLASLAGCATTQTPSSALDSLGRELRELRALPAGAPSKANCPRDSKQLVGLNRTEIRAALGEPDYIEEPTWTYIFTSPVPAGQFGGGFPELSMAFGGSGQVVNVACRYSR